MTVLSSIPWPTTLPPPFFDSAAITVGTPIISRRRSQSGRVEQRYFGGTGPDMLSLKWRFDISQLEIFRRFFVSDLDLGTKWFSASWVAAIGYPVDYVGKFIGYPAEASRRWENGAFGYSEISCNVAVANSLLQA